MHIARNNWYGMLGGITNNNMSAIMHFQTYVIFVLRDKSNKTVTKSSFANHKPNSATIQVAG